MPGRGRPFKKGNAGGRLKTGAAARKRTAVAAVLLKELTEHVLDCREYVDSVRRRVLAGKADHVELFLLQQRYGKPPDRVQVEGQHRVLNIVLRRPLGSYDPLADDGPPIEASEPIGLPPEPG